MVQTAVKVKFSSVMVDGGVQFVTPTGQLLMLKWCAEGWDSQQLVCSQPLM